MEWIVVPADSTDEFGWNLESAGIFLSRTQKRLILVITIAVVLAGLLWFLLAASAG